MIKFEKAEVWGFQHAIRGMRNPLNSWGRSDTKFYPYDHECEIGENDLDLMTRLIRGGQPHRKFLRQIFVSVDITAPLYWWKEFDTYKVGTTANSCSTMHKIHAKEFTMDDFSTDHMFETDDHAFEIENGGWYPAPISFFQCIVIPQLNAYRDKYLATKDKKWWYLMIQLLPTSYNQQRTILLNYEVLTNIYHSRKNHKLTEWHDFCRWIEGLPFAELITGVEA